MSIEEKEIILTKNTLEEIQKWAEENDVVEMDKIFKYYRVNDAGKRMYYSEEYLMNTPLAIVDEEWEKFK